MKNVLSIIIPILLTVCLILPSMADARPSASAKFSTTREENPNAVKNHVVFHNREGSGRTALLDNLRITDTAPGDDAATATVTVNVTQLTPGDLSGYVYLDSDGDGVGDFRGLTSKIDYLNDGDPTTDTDLGIDGIWLMPITESPSYHGYDTVDYDAVDREYGTEKDLLESGERTLAVLAAGHDVPRLLQLILLDATETLVIVGQQHGALAPVAAADPGGRSLRPAGAAA